MRFRPCIDIHNGKVKQIVGGSLQDADGRAKENFVSEQDSVFYAKLYKGQGIRGGHVILLNADGAAGYDKTKEQALSALGAYPGGLQAGGGIRPDNAEEFLKAGASHVIVTSYVFRDGEISWGNLQNMVKAVGKERLVLDLSCRRRDGDYYIVTDRWQKFTDVTVTPSILDELSGQCDEFLVHAVDVEGKSSGVDTKLIRILAQHRTNPITYAGGVGSYEDLYRLRDAGENRIDVTVGSALDLFGGPLKFENVLQICQS